MASDKRLIDALIAINSISNDGRLPFGRKLQDILLAVVECMKAKSGSIMLVKSRKSLEVIASTNVELIGVKQHIDEESPSTWVVKYRAPLYIDNISNSDIFQKRFDNYEGDAFLLMPIIGNGKVIGVLNVTNKIGKDLFSKEEHQALLNIAGQVISALEIDRLAESLKRSRRTLRHKNLRLKKLEKLKTDLFNMLIHDLKGPISELIANLDVLSYTVSEENREQVESAKAGCDSLYGMVCNLLDVAQLEEGRIELIYEKIDPEDLIKEALARLFELGKIKELTFVEKFPHPKSMDFFWGDRGMLLRVVQNLLTNAINYSPPGEKIEVGFEYLKTRKIEFFVIDKGPGVPINYQKGIFDKFFQLEKKGEARIHTIGLGLAFCKMAMKAHGGAISVKSKPREGSRFFFILPIEKKRRN